MDTSDRISEVYKGEIMSAKSQAAAQARIAWILERVCGSTVLDIGCSQGIVSILLARDGKSVTGVDIDPESIEYAKRELALEDEGTRGRLTLVQGDALEQDFQDNSYDTVIMGQLIEHVTEPELFLDLARRACKASGAVIMTTPFGVLEHSDHKRTFYLYQFVKLVNRFLVLREIDIVGKRICFCGQPREANCADILDPRAEIDEQWQTRIHELSEPEFERIEREKNEQLSTRARRIIELQRRIENLEKRIIEFQSQYSRQVELLKSSVTFRVGEATIGAIRPSRATIALPFRFWRILMDYLSSQRRHKRSVSTRNHEQRLPRPVTASGSSVRLGARAKRVEEARILFVPTNGAGLGHVTRLLAIARRLKAESRIAESVFLTTSDALNIFRREGFVAYHFPSPDLLRGRIRAGEWNGGVQDLLTGVIRNHEINAIVFDGVFPYSGITNVVAGRDDLVRVWVRRGMLKDGVEEKVRSAEKYFHLQLVPGELGQVGVLQDGPGRIIVPPIVFLDRKELLSREQAIESLGLSSEKKTAFVQLPAGNVRAIDTEVEIIIEVLSGFEGVQIVLANSIIARSVFGGFKDVKVIQDYPLSRYYLGFDFAISAAGYNSVNELVYFGMPSILIPREEAQADDQVARAMIASREGAALVLNPFSATMLREYVEILLNETNNRQYRSRCLAAFRENGADSAARALADLFLSDRDK